MHVKFCNSYLTFGSSMENKVHYITLLLFTGIIMLPAAGIAQQAAFDSPDVLLQGGDNISEAFPITALPFSDAGSTSAYADDYDGNCGDYPDNAPDVVYSFSPLADMTLTATLCGESDFDTKLYVLDGSPGNIIACNDDFCSNQYSEYVSGIRCLDLVAGHTYYIIIDGYGNAMGHYSLDLYCGTPAGAISGSVLETNGNPICGASVTVSQDGNPVWSDTTDSFGNYIALGVADGVYMLEAAKERYITQIQGPISARLCDPAVVDFVLVNEPPPPIGAISGFVINGDSSLPLPDAIVIAFQDGNEIFRDTSGIDGYYFMPDMQLGFYDMEASHPDFVTQTLHGIEVFMDQTTSADFALYHNCDYAAGDLNHSGVFNGIDVTFAVSYFKGGTVPPYSCFCHNYVWYVEGDFNGDCQFNGNDITRMVGYLKGFWAPAWCPDCPPTSR